MTEIRFPLGRRGKRSDAPPEQADVQPGRADDPLAEMSAQIRELDAAAERIAARIAESAERLRAGQLSGGSAARDDLLAGLASALVDRTDEMRADCARLSALMERTAKLIADQERTAPPERTAPREPLDDFGDIAPFGDDPLAPTGFEPDTELDRELGSETLEPESEKPTWLERPTHAAPETPSPTTSEGVRLIATQMAIAGSSRAEIERRLRIQFGVRDAHQALDEIFGTRHSEVG